MVGTWGVFGHVTVRWESSGQARFMIYVFKSEKRRLCNKDKTGHQKRYSCSQPCESDGDGSDNVGSIRSGESDWVKVYFESQTHNMLINQAGGLKERWESRITPTHLTCVRGM